MKKKMIDLMSRGLVLVTAIATLSLASCEREPGNEPDVPNEKGDGVEILLDDSMMRALPGDADYNVTAIGGGGDIEVKGLGHYPPEKNKAILTFQVKQGYMLNYAGRKDGSRTAPRIKYDNVVGANWDIVTPSMPAAEEMVIDLKLLPSEVNKIYISADYEPIDDELKFMVWPEHPDLSEIGMVESVPDGTSGLIGRTIPIDHMDVYTSELYLYGAASEKLGTGLSLYDYADVEVLAKNGFYEDKTSTGVPKGIDYIYDEFPIGKYFKQRYLNFADPYPSKTHTSRGDKLNMLGYSDNFITRAIFDIYRHYNYKMLEASKDFKDSGIPPRYNPYYWPYLRTQVSIVKQMDADLMKIVNGLKYMMPATSETPTLKGPGKKPKLLTEHPKEYKLSELSADIRSSRDPRQYAKELLYARKYNFELYRIRQELLGWSFLSGGYPAYPAWEMSVSHPAYDSAKVKQRREQEVLPFKEMPSFIIDTNDALTHYLQMEMVEAAKKAPYLLTPTEFKTYSR